MKLRKKVLLIISVTMLALIAILYSTSRVIVLRSFSALEEDQTTDHVRRIRNVVMESVSTLDTTLFDWAAWDDTYEFIEDGNADYIASNLVDETFTSTRLNLMLFLNSAGEIVFSKAIDYQAVEEIPLPRGLQAHLSSDSPLLRHSTPQSSVKGILLLPDAPLLIASRPIITSQEEGPIRGTMLMARVLDATEIKRFAGITHSEIQVLRFDDPILPPDVQQVRRPLLKEAPILTQTLNTHVIAGYTGTS